MAGVYRPGSCKRFNELARGGLNAENKRAESADLEAGKFMTVNEAEEDLSSGQCIIERSLHGILDFAAIFGRSVPRMYPPNWDVDVNKYSTINSDILGLLPGKQNKHENNLYKLQVC